MTKAGEMIISGFVSKIISDIVDIPENPIKDAIRNADKKGRGGNQSIETRIYQVTIDAIKEFTQKDYKGQDVLYDAAESIIRGFKNSNNNIEAVRVGLKMLVSQVTSETCVDFLKILQHEICMDENDILYKEIILNQGGETFEAVREGSSESNRNHEETHRKLDYAIEGIDSIDKKMDEIANNEAKHYEILIKNRAEEYADKWDKNVFLNDFNEEDENAGVNIKLKDIYRDECLPHYIWKTNSKPSDRLGDLLAKYVIDKNGRKMLLILGQPGIGKSTLITWMLANLIGKKEDIYVYQFAFDLKNVNWESDNILYEIFEVLNLRYDELENKTLILDGFDEIYVKGDRGRILKKINQELKQMNFLQDFHLCFTSRVNYVDRTQLEGNDYITLQTWNEQQIKYFCEIYGKEIIRKDSGIENKMISEIQINKIIEKKEIFGIPLILYMILALNVAVEKHSSIVDIYDQIFSLTNGSIYERYYDAEHRINAPEIKRYIHNIFQKIAFWIFENNADKASIPQEKFVEICDDEMKKIGKNGKDIQSDVLIGNYFLLIKNCEGEGTEELQFVHRSIYEYFVAVYFSVSISNLTSKEEVAGKLGELLKTGRLSKQILEFVKYKFDKIRKYNLADITRDVFNIMLKDGMTYHMGKPIFNAMDQEMNIFANMLEVVLLWNSALGKLNFRIASYLMYNYLPRLNLKGIILKDECLNWVQLPVTNLEGADLEGVNLEGAYLSGSNLKGAYLSKAFLMGANMTSADLRNAYMVGAWLSYEHLISLESTKKEYLSIVKLEGANLENVIFDEEQVNWLSEKYDLSNSMVYLSETDETIGYGEYCIRKQKPK